MPTNPIKILAVSGSMRAGSHGARALSLLLEAAREHGAQTRLLDLREADLPMFRPGATVQVAAVSDVLETVQWADAFVLGTPDYHGSMSGAMKNFLDYHWQEFAGKLFAFVCTSHEKGLTPMEQMRTVVRQCYGWSLPYGLSFAGSEAFDANGQLVSDAVAARIDMTARDLSIYGALLRDQFIQDIEGDAADTFAARYRS
jgi:NAD(P)H-dependent FMN reductase